MKTLKILFEIALLPGRAIQWINYMFPQKGEIFTSARRRNSIIFRIIYSIIGWALYSSLSQITTTPKNLHQHHIPHQQQATSNKPQIDRKKSSTVTPI